MFRPALLYPLDSPEGKGLPCGSLRLDIFRRPPFFQVTVSNGHPHISSRQACYGNAQEIALALVRDNNVKELIRHMAAYRLGYNEGDQLDPNWAARSAMWWVDRPRPISAIVIQDGQSGEVAPFGQLVVPRGDVRVAV